MVFPWGSWRHLAILGFLPQTTVEALLSKWQLPVAATDSLCFSRATYKCFTLTSSTVLSLVFILNGFQLTPAQQENISVSCWSSGLCRYCPIAFITIFSVPSSYFSFFHFFLSFCFKVLQLCFVEQLTFQEELKYKKSCWQRCVSFVWRKFIKPVCCFSFHIYS